MHMAPAFVIFVFEVFCIVLGMISSLAIEKRCLSAPRILFVSQQMFMLIYVIFFLNPFNFDHHSNEEIVDLICMFEVFSSAFIDLIYLFHLHFTACESGLPFLAITFFIISAFFLFAAVSVCEWLLSDPMASLASKLLSYQLTQVFLFLLIIICIMRLTYLQDVEHQKPLDSFVPYFVLTFATFVLFTVLPRFGYVVYILLGAEEKNETVLMVLKTMIFIAPLYNLFFVVMVNIQDPEQRSELMKSLQRSLRGMKTGPVPRINVQEPTTSEVAPMRSHIALNLMRNPLNSFNKLQRRTTEPAPIPPISLLVPKEQRYLAKVEDEDLEENAPIATEQEILSSRNADEKGFRTVAMLKRASMIGMRFQNIRSDSARSTPRTPATKSEMPVEPVTVTSPVDSPHSLDVHALGIFSNTSLTVAPMKRQKRAVERIKEVLRRQESSVDECEK